MEIPSAPAANSPLEHWTALARRAGYRCDQLPAVAAMSERTVRRRIRELFRTTVELWLRQVRMSDAPALVHAGLRTKEISRRLGYEQPSHFCRHFKQHFGMTVRQWRKADDADTPRKGR